MKAYLTNLQMTQSWEGWEACWIIKYVGWYPWRYSWVRAMSQNVISSRMTLFSWFLWYTLSWFSLILCRGLTFPDFFCSFPLLWLSIIAQVKFWSSLILSLISPSLLLSLKLTVLYAKTLLYVDTISPLLQPLTIYSQLSIITSWL